MYFDEIPDVISSLHSLVKRNNGLFKSAKQADFLKKVLKRDYNDFIPVYAGINEDGNYATWTGWMNWADYGRRSTRQYGWIFKYDDFGITNVWKLKWKETPGYYDNNMNYRPSGQMVIDPKGTKMTFERPEGLDMSSIKESIEKAAEVTPEEAASEYVGTVGEVYDNEVEVVSTFVSHAGYYGPTTIIGMKDADGNKLVWFSSGMASVERGEKIRIKGRVKKHEEYRGVKQTTLTRCKVFDLKAA